MLPVSSFWVRAPRVTEGTDDRSIFSCFSLSRGFARRFAACVGVRRARAGGRRGGRAMNVHDSRPDFAILGGGL
ncbi:hypothetical protein, partial [Burkholderia multivorans]|uniref:hypothetical protein n=1 Tax=Burkholderia multivorans TaxID=87883 RepID=UPI000277E210